MTSSADSQKRAKPTIAVRECCVCKKILVRRASEPPSKFKVRQSCGAFTACMDALRRSRGIAPPARNCLICGAELIRYERQAPNFAIRKSCGGEQCVRILKSMAHARPGLSEPRFIESRNCIICNAPLIRGEKEYWGRFRNRQTCWEKVGVKSLCLRELARRQQSKKYDFCNCKFTKAELAELTGISISCITNRLSAGMSILDCITTPVGLGVKSKKRGSIS
jgi:hypothetical protein